MRSRRSGDAVFSLRLHGGVGWMSVVTKIEIDGQTGVKMEGMSDSSRTILNLFLVWRF